MKSLSQVARELLTSQHFDSLAYALLDFDTKKFESFCIVCHGNSEGMPIYFDLASLTKPLTLAALYHRHSRIFSESELMLLEHRAGLPAWGKLSHSHWKEELFLFELLPSKVIYSDYSALRLMLELEKKSDKNLNEMCSFYWDKELCFWLDLPITATCPPTGYRGGKLVMGEVHDSNAWNLGVFCSHAGLFGTVEGLARSLLALDRETEFVEQMKEGLGHFGEEWRFVRGWDTVREEDSLAGKGCGGKTFGHLGFTGTSVWIDSEHRRGQILLTNGCHPWQYAKRGLNRLRRKLGELGWRY